MYDGWINGNLAASADVTKHGFAVVIYTGCYAMRSESVGKEYDIRSNGLGTLYHSLAQRISDVSCAHKRAAQSITHSKCDKLQLDIATAVDYKNFYLQSNAFYVISSHSRV